MLGAEELGGGARREQVGRAGDADRERLQPLAVAGQVAGGDRRDQGRVEAAGEEDADRDVAHHLALDRVDQHQPGPHQGVARHVLGGDLARRGGEQGAGDGRREPDQAGLGGPEEAGREDVDLAAQLGLEGGHLGGEDGALLVLGPVERLDPDRVAGGEEVAGAAGHREGEHPVQLGQPLGALALDHVQRDLVVGGGAEAVVAEPAAQRRVVVDLAVADEAQLLAAAAQGLVAAGDVDDREPAVAEPGPVELGFALVVGAAMGQPFEHPAPGLRVRRAVLGSDSTHPRRPTLRDSPARAQASAGLGAGIGAGSGDGSGRTGRRAGRRRGGAGRSTS